MSDHAYTAGNPANFFPLGYQIELVAGYAYSSQECGATPIFRLHSDANTDHFYTTDPQERQQVLQGTDYTDQGIDGYILPA